MDVIKEEKTRGHLWEGVSLKDYLSFRVGGKVDYLYIPSDLNALSHFLRHIPPSMPVNWLGLGSNTLVRDGGLEGVVIITQGSLNSLQNMTSTLIRAEAGVSSAQFARYAARQGLKGVEFMAGIPGTIGGALAMNAGCYGGETWDHVEAVETINRQGELMIRPHAHFDIHYREVKRSPNEWFIAGHFALSSGEKETSLQAIRELLEKRNASQPTGTANCGSVFRNPEGTFAGKLIESCGLKGKKIGGASVSVKHANFIINESHATASDIENLIEAIRDEVLKQTGIQLLPEVCIIGKKT